MLTSPYSSDPSAGIGEAIGITLVVLLYLAMIAFGVYLYMRVARKAGWTLWHGLLMLVPIANLVFLVMFAFMEWPVERRLKEAEARLAQLGAGGPYGEYPASGGYPGGGTYGVPGYGYGAPTGYGAAGAYGAAPGQAGPGQSAPGGYVPPVPPYGAPTDAPPTGAPDPSSPWDPPAAPPAPPR